MLNPDRLQKQVPFFEELNKPGYVVTQLDFQHCAGWVGSTEKEAGHANSKNLKYNKETVPKSIADSSSLISFLSEVSEWRLPERQMLEVTMRCAALFPSKGLASMNGK